VATERLAKLAKASGVQRFIFASSCSIYNQFPKNTILHDELSRVDPQEHYSRSKYLAEQAILPLNDNNFTVVALRKGTVVGSSPRMRFDLVVNTMVKTAFTLGKIVVYDGSQYRPLIDVQDAVAAYLAVLTAPKEKVAGQIFNVLQKNYLIKPLADSVATSLHKLQRLRFPVEVQTDVKDRSYRVETSKFRQAVGFVPQNSMADSVKSLVNFIAKRPKLNLSHPKYYNIQRMKQVIRGKR